MLLNILLSHALRRIAGKALILVSVCQKGHIRYAAAISDHLVELRRQPCMLDLLYLSQGMISLDRVRRAFDIEFSLGGGQTLDLVQNQPFVFLRIQSSSMLNLVRVLAREFVENVALVLCVPLHSKHLKELGSIFDRFERQ